MGDLRAVCVFCGSSTPPDVRYRRMAEAVGALLAARGIDLVYGGGRVGLMGHVADACLAAGGRVTGVIPVGLFGREIAHRGVTTLHEVGSMHERKQLMYDLSDGFMALPGGLGTLEELAEVATWSQLGIHAKRVVLVDVERFWEPLVAQLDGMVAIGLVKPENRDLVGRATSAAAALDALEGRTAAVAEGWITPDER